MALVVNTNIQSINAQRNLDATGRMLGKSLERLSSGLRINNASDDAGGLAIATRLNAQVRGLNQAIRNANDGTAMLQTAEGALSEITSIVTRVKELAVQSANGTNSTADRTNLNAEVASLISEVTRIASQTKFGSAALLDGTFSGTFQVGVEAGQTVSTSVASFKASSLSGSVATQSLSFNPAIDGTGGAVAGTYLGVNGSTELLITGPKGSAYVRQTVDADDSLSAIEKSRSAVATAAAINEMSSTTGVSAAVTAATFTVGDAAERFDAIDLDGVTEGVWINGQAVVVDLDGGSQAARRQQFIDAVNAQVSGVVASAGAGNGGLVLTAADGRNISVRTVAGVADGDSAEEILGMGTAPTTESVVARGGVTLTAAGNITSAYTAQTVTGEGASAAVAVNLASVSISSVANANTALIVLDSMLDTISAARGSLGAVQNRLASTVSNLSVVSEKVSDAKSRIMDADFAAETAALTKAQILQQAGLSVLSQANSAPQAALSLLRNLG